MKCKVCGERLQAGHAVIKFEGLEMETPVSVKSLSYSGGVCHVGCICGLQDVVMAELAERCFPTEVHAVMGGEALCVR